MGRDARPDGCVKARTAGAFAPVFVFLLLQAPCVASGESLLEAYKLARQSDPKFRAAQAEAKASGTALEQAWSGYRPNARFEADHVDTRQRILSSNNPVFGTGLSIFPTSGYTLSVTQPVFRKDVIERIKQARFVVRQANYVLLAAEQDLLLRTTAAYLSVLAASDSVALAAAERQAVRSALDLARERLTGGVGTITNLHDASARHAVTQAREIEAQNKLNDARQGLREITDRLIVAYQSLRDTFSLMTPDPPLIETWVSTAYEANLSLRARREGVEVARQEVERQRAGHFPTLNVVASRNRRDAGSTLFGGGSTVETTDLTLRLNVPLYEGGLTSAVTEEAAQRYQKSQEEHELERRAVERQTRAAFEGTLSGIRLVEALRESVQAQQSALAAKEQAFRSGLLTLLPVLDAQRDLFLARRDHAQARYDYLLNTLKLKQAVGTLAEADLERLSVALQ